MMKKNKTLRNNKGFSLIEMLIAITVFAVGLLAMAQLQTHSIVYNAQAQRYTEATIYAQSKMDEIMAAGYAAATSEDKQQISGTPYFITTTVADNFPLADTKSVGILVEWTSRGAKSFTLSTVIAKHDR